MPQLCTTDYNRHIHDTGLGSLQWQDNMVTIKTWSSSVCWLGQGNTLDMKKLWMKSLHPVHDALLKKNLSLTIMTKRALAVILGNEEVY